MTRATASWIDTVIEDFESGDILDPTKFRNQVLQLIEYLAQLHDHRGDPNGAVLTYMFDRTSMVSNLVIRNDTTSPDNKVVITADDLTVSDGEQKISATGAVNVTADITVSGAGGRESGLTEAAATWYYIHIIRKSGDGTVNGLISTSPTTPNLPTGYDQWRRVGVVRNTDASVFRDFYQLDDFVMIDPVEVVSVAGDSTSFSSAVNLQSTGAVPPVSRRAVMVAEIERDSGSQADGVVFSRPNGATNLDLGHWGPVLDRDGKTSDTFDLPLDANQRFQWRTLLDVGDTIWFYVNGFYGALGPVPG